MNRRFIAVWMIVLVAFVGRVVAQQSPYAGFEERSVKALSSEQIAAYESGDGMGLALAGELNGYPGPKHVLELQEVLGLSSEQLRLVERVYLQMKASAVELGKEIVVLERELDERFADRSITSEYLSAQVDRIAALKGNLRVAHLQAHLRMREILSAEQIDQYVSRRGYHHAGDHAAHGHRPGSDDGH